MSYPSGYNITSLLFDPQLFLQFICFPLTCGQDLSMPRAVNDKLIAFEFFIQTCIVILRYQFQQSTAQVCDDTALSRLMGFYLKRR